MGDDKGRRPVARWGVRLFCRRSRIVGSIYTCRYQRAPKDRCLHLITHTSVCMYVRQIFIFTQMIAFQRRLRVKKLHLVMLISVFLIGCADSYNLAREKKIEHDLSKSATAYVVVPRDGRYGSTIYQGSGQNTAQLITASLLRYIRVVFTSEDFEEYSTAIEKAKSKTLSLVFYPTILHWEDRATEWSGIPDRASVKISVYDVNTETEVDSVIIEGTSGLATFGGDHPQDLLLEPISEYISTIFGKPNP